jgi:excisionase family DNA binding protein
MPNAKPTHAALYVRLPVAEAAKLDRAAFELKAAKQDLVTGLVARYVEPGTDEGLDLLRELAGIVIEAKREKNPDGFGFGDRRRVVVETEADTMTVGRHVFRPADQPDVLNVKQAAALLQVQEETVTELADAGELPGRKLGGEWRFARRALLTWLAGGEEG